MTTDTHIHTHTALDAWIDAHFDEEVQFLQALVRVPTDTPPGNNAPHAERTAELLSSFGFEAEKYPVPAAQVKDYGMESITNLVVRRPKIVFLGENVPTAEQINDLHERAHEQCFIANSVNFEIRIV